MSNPPNEYNTNSSFNKYKGTYFNNDVDVSGGDIINRNGNLYLAPNSSIFTENNQIQFNEEFQFCDFTNNVNVLGQLKTNYNSVEYDVGLQCEKTDNLIDDIATLSPIVSDTAFKCTNFYYNQASNSTVWSGLLTCPISSIASTAIANTTRFIEGTGNQNIGGIKRFTSNIRIDAGMQLSAGTITLTNAQLQAIPDISTLKTITTAISYTPATVTTIISNVLQYTGTLNGWSTTNFSNAINYAKDLTSSAQTQINTLTTNSVSLSALNTFSGATNTFTNNIRLDSSLLLNAGALTLTNANLQKLQYCSTISSDIQTQVTNLNTKTTKISYMSVGGINTTTILDGLISQTFSFTGTINNISTTTFGYLSGVTSSIQQQINNFNGVSLSANNSFTGSNTFANITFTGTLNNISNTVYGYLSGATENLQTAINALKTKTDTTNINLATTTTSANEATQRTTDIEFSDIGGNQTTISNKCVLGEVQFNTDLNDITPTTFGYLQGVSSPIQTQIDSKTRIPTGTIIMSVGDSLQNSQPLIWLKCDGQAVSRTVYVDLYQYILSRYGSGDGSTTFNVPNFQACFLRGGMYFPETERVVNGTTYTPNGPLTIQQDSLEAHVHSSNLSGNYLRSGTTSNTSDAFLIGPARPNRSDFPAFGGGVSSSHRTSTETRPLNHSIFYYIKT